MPAKLVLHPPGPSSDKQWAQTILLGNQGLIIAKPGGSGIAFTGEDMARIGLGEELIRRITQWTQRYAAAREGLPYGYTPEDCVEFRVERHNREGQSLATGVAKALHDPWQVVFMPNERKKYLHKSLLRDLCGNLYNAQPRLTEWGDGTPIMPERLASEDDFPGHWVRFMFDQSSSCLWDASGFTSTTEGFPIEPVLASALEDEIDALRSSWEDWDFEDAMHPRFTPEYLAERLRFAQSGLAMAQKIKAVLPDDWTVVYFDIERAAHSAVRGKFEYRV